MSRWIPIAPLLAGLLVSPARPIPADDGPSEAVLKPFIGRWSRPWELKDGGAVRHLRVLLHFRDGEVTLATEEGGKKGNEYTLKVLAVEEGKDASHLVLGFGKSRYVVYFDIHGDRLILIGRMVNR